MSAAEHLRRSGRLRSRKDFTRIQGQGQKVQTRHIVALWTPGRGRLGLTVSSRVGNAVERNRVKRWLREIFRRDRAALPAGIDLVLIGRSGSPEAGYETLRREFAQAVRRIGG